MLSTAAGTLVAAARRPLQWVIMPAPAPSRGTGEVLRAFTDPEAAGRQVDDALSVPSERTLAVPEHRGQEDARTRASVPASS